MKVCIIGDPRSPNLREMVKAVFNHNDSILIISQFVSPGINSHKLFSIFERTSIFSKSQSGSNPAASRSFIAHLIRCFPVSSAATLCAYRILQWLRILELPLHIYQAKKVIRRFRPDIILAFRTQLEGYLASFAAPGAFVLFTQGSDIEYFALRDPIHFILTRHALINSCGVIVDASRDLFYIQKVFPGSVERELVSLGNGGITLPDIPRTSLYSRPLSILCVRPPAPYIDHLTLFKAIHILQSRCGVPDFTFSIIAQPHFCEQLSTQAAIAGLDHHAISFIPFLEKEDYHSLLRSSSIVVSPSRTDGIPISLVEAMAFGCLPVASSILSLGDLITDGLNGLIYAPGDSLSLSRALFRALIDAEFRVSAFDYSSRYILDQFSKDVVSPRLRSFIVSKPESRLL